MPVFHISFSSNLSAGRDSSSALPVCHKESVRQLAPIALFVYNRPEHTRRTVEALQRNHLAAESDLFIFTDAALTPEAAASVQRVRSYLAGIEGFKSVHTIAREKNLGLAHSIVDGVTRVCSEYSRAIVL